MREEEEPEPPAGGGTELEPQPEPPEAGAEPQPPPEDDAVEAPQPDAAGADPQPEPSEFDAVADPQPPPPEDEGAAACRLLLKRFDLMDDDWGFASQELEDEFIKHKCGERLLTDEGLAQELVGAHPGRGAGRVRM